MSRSAIYAIVAVLGGPAVAFLVIAVGCTSGWDVGCGHNGYISLVLFTLAAWVAFIALYGIRLMYQMFKRE